MPPRFGQLSRLTAADLRALHARGVDYLNRVEAELRGPLTPFEIPVGPHVSVGSDWATEITRQAGRARAELVLAQAQSQLLRGLALRQPPLDHTAQHLEPVQLLRAHRPGSRTVHVGLPARDGAWNPTSLSCSNPTFPFCAYISRSGNSA